MDRVDQLGVTATFKPATDGTEFSVPIPDGSQVAAVGFSGGVWRDRTGGGGGDSGDDVHAVVLGRASRGFGVHAAVHGVAAGERGGAWVYSENRKEI
jgi:hypothetical protein